MLTPVSGSLKHGPMKRILLVAALAIALATLVATASLMDSLLANATEGRLRVMHTSGTLWHGKGALCKPRCGRSQCPTLAFRRWQAVRSRRRTCRLAREAGQIVLRRARAAGHFDHPRGPGRAPAAGTSDSLPSPVARAAGGMLRIASEGIDCDWNQDCHGTARLTWLDASVDLLPQQRFGDYEVLAQAENRRSIQVRTLGGRSASVARAAGVTERRPPRIFMANYLARKQSSGACQCHGRLYVRDRR